MLTMRETEALRDWEMGEGMGQREEEREEARRTFDVIIVISEAGCVDQTVREPTNLFFYTN